MREGLVPSRNVLPSPVLQVCQQVWVQQQVPATARDPENWGLRLWAGVGHSGSSLLPVPPGTNWGSQEGPGQRFGSSLHFKTHGRASCTLPLPS